MDAFIHSVQMTLDPYVLLLIFLGTVGGVIVGALPGLSASMATALLLPFTVGIPPFAAIALLAALYCAGTYGGSITAILINTPGAPPAVATVIEGYPMAMRGEAGRALGMATMASTIGGIFSVFAFVIAAPALARVAYAFGPPEYFALTLFGMSMLASISSGSAAKNLMGGAFGVLVSTIGIDFTTGVERFTFGFPEMTQGIDFIPVMIGLFAGSELLTQAGSLEVVYKKIVETAIKLPTKEDYKKCWKTIVRSCFIGTFIGILPAEGATVAALVGYAEAKRWSKHPEEFGKGAIEGIAGAETANNAATGGAMAPTLALGIPGSGTTAVILGALLMHGVRPGPYLFKEQPEFLYGLFVAMLIANIMFMGIGLVGAKIFARITLIPNAFLWPAVMILATIGSYALNQSMLDVWFMLGFGVIGYVFRRYGFAAAPIIMGLILGEMVENTLKQSLLLFEGNWLEFLQRPIALVFFALTVAGLCGPFIFDWIINRNRPKAA